VLSSSVAVFPNGGDVALPDGDNAVPHHSDGFSSATRLAASFVSRGEVKQRGGASKASTACRVLDARSGGV
jgi:hypothetical protein